MRIGREMTMRALPRPALVYLRRRLTLLKTPHPRLLPNRQKGLHRWGVSSLLPQLLRSGTRQIGVEIVCPDLLPTG